jgi:hypothetical protein
VLSSVPISYLFCFVFAFFIFYFFYFFRTSTYLCMGPGAVWPRLLFVMFFGGRVGGRAGFVMEFTSFFFSLRWAERLMMTVLHLWGVIFSASVEFWHIFGPGRKVRAESTAACV